MEILCAYVRENAPASLTDDWPTDHTGIMDRKRTGARSDRPRSDVALALAIIGRRHPEQIKIEREQIPEYKLDLSFCNLRFAALNGWDYSNASFFRSTLNGAFCQNTVFSGCNFNHSTLVGLSGDGANFDKSKLGRTSFTSASLHGSHFMDCDFQLSNFRTASLKASRIRFKLNETGRDVSRAEFINSNMKGAVIEGDVLGVNFCFDDKSVAFGHHKVAFKRARNVDTRDFMTKKSDQPGKDVGITDRIEAFGDNSVRIIAGLDRPAHWPDWDLDLETFCEEWRKWQADPDSYTPPPKPAP